MVKDFARVIVTAATLGAGVCLAQEPAAPEASLTPVERVRLAVERGDAAGALVWYERAVTPANQRPELLAQIAGVRAAQLLSDPDARVVVEACRAQVAVGSISCLNTARRIAEDTSGEMTTRLAAAAVLVDAGAQGADAMLRTLIGIAASDKPAAAADAASRLPATSATPSLVALATGDDREAKYVATLGLLRLQSKEALAALRIVAADQQAGAARLFAQFGLAGAGDREARKVLEETLPLMNGRDLLEAGRALVALKDPRGASILRDMARGNDELLRIEAAEALHATDPELAATIIRGLASGGNPWVRARALEVAATLRLTPTPDMRRALLDSNSWVAVRAVQALAAAAGASGGSPKAAR